jgi:hypothetical protein
VKVQAPTNSGPKFFNHKHNFSVLLLVLVDALYKFTVLDMGSCGRKAMDEFLHIPNLGNI